MKLTEKQKRFCDEYLIDLNATQAAIRAGYSKKTAYRTGADNLIKPQIQEYLGSKMKDREKRTEITQDKVIKELAAIAFSKGSDYAKVVDKIITVDGNVVLDESGLPQTYQDVELMLTDELTEEQKKAISNIKRGKNGIEVSTYDKVRALELLGKHLGMFKDKVEVSGVINNPFAELTTEQLIKLAGGKDG